MVTQGQETGERLTYTVEEAGRALGIGRVLAYRLARSGTLPGVLRLGGRYVVSRAGLNAAMGAAPQDVTQRHGESERSEREDPQDGP